MKKILLTIFISVLVLVGFMSEVQAQDIVGLVSNLPTSTIILIALLGLSELLPFIKLVYPNSNIELILTALSKIRIMISNLTKTRF